MKYLLLFKHREEPADEWELDYYESENLQEIENQVNSMIKYTDSYKDIRVFEAKELKLITQAVKIKK